MRIRTEEEINKYIQNKIQILEKDEKEVRNGLRSLRRIISKRELTEYEQEEKINFEKKWTLISNEISTLRSIQFHISGEKALAKALKEIKS